MKTIEVDEMKRIQLLILIDVANFCEENGIRYFLAAGTMLGAVRHHGFIPWDDDIDISLPRPDYNRLINEYKNRRYVLHCWDNERDFLCPYTKIEDPETVLIDNLDFGKSIGVNIDVFPVDGLPNGRVNIDKTVLLMKSLWGLVVCSTVKDISRRSRIKKFEIRLMRKIYKLTRSQSFVTGLTVKTAQRCPFDQSDKVAVLVWGYGKKEVVPRCAASEYIKVKFEGHTFNISKFYDVYLNSIYGDYMQLPPENERINKHHFVAYWK